MALIQEKFKLFKSDNDKVGMIRLEPKPGGGEGDLMLTVTTKDATSKCFYGKQEATLLKKADQYISTL